MKPTEVVKLQAEREKENQEAKYNLEMTFAKVLEDAGIEISKISVRETKLDHTNRLVIEIYSLSKKDRHESPKGWPL